MRPFPGPKQHLLLAEQSKGTKISATGKGMQLTGHAVTNILNFDRKNDDIRGENSFFLIDSSFISK